MDKLVIEGGVRLKGEVTVSGAKNSVLPILAATLLTDDACIIKGVPDLRDTSTMLKILRSLGKNVECEKGVVTA
ncbi:MAG TPA: UDP-N-acetylglucosamine 1-carboxyvinyltransferase, partial [Candidatus Margulisiibacteriota bacterium]|nr:UDP-N-acetylglucosamine 1-carboxyvinyltransferase [Candidatus Margulisiibacteriota bacterium]